MILSRFIISIWTALLLAAPPALSSDAALPKGRDFGAGLTLANTISLSQLVAQPERYAAEPVLLAGRLTDLCTKKGCWTVLSEGEATLRIRFHDYGFFLPPESLGARALVEGVAEVRTLSEREARHLASEARGGNPDSIQGPQRELGFIATGVRLIETKSRD